MLTCCALIVWSLFSPLFLMFSFFVYYFWHFVTISDHVCYFWSYCLIFSFIFVTLHAGLWSLVHSLIHLNSLFELLYTFSDLLYMVCKQWNTFFDLMYSFSDLLYMVCKHFNKLDLNYRHFPIFCTQLHNYCILLSYFFIIKSSTLCLYSIFWILAHLVADVCAFVWKCLALEDRYLVGNIS
jgi:hypothetical protein